MREDNADGSISCSVSTRWNSYARFFQPAGGLPFHHHDVCMYFVDTLAAQPIRRSFQKNLSVDVGQARIGETAYGLQE